MYSRIIYALIALCLLNCTNLFADEEDHRFAHTHIGVNPTWRPDWSDPGNADKAEDPDLTDDNKLWFFSVPPVHPVAPTPGWPNWQTAEGGVFLRLTPQLDGGSIIPKGDGSGKILWQCSFLYGKNSGYGDPTGFQHLDGWHSAHGPQGAWNLSSVDEATVPAWNIGIKREGASIAEDDFFMADEDGGPLLLNDGDTYLLDKHWLEDKTAWGFHEHMSFHFWLTPDIGQTVSASFSAFDTSGMYQSSDVFDIEFVTVPEPASIVLCMLGSAALIRKK